MVLTEQEDASEVCAMVLSRPGMFLIGLSVVILMGCVSAIAEADAIPVFVEPIPLQTQADNKDAKDLQSHVVNAISRVRGLRARTQQDTLSTTTLTPSEYSVTSNLVIQKDGSVQLFLFSHHTTDGATQAHIETAPSFAALNTQFDAIDLAPLFPLNDNPDSRFGSVLVVPMHTIDDKSINITNRVVTLLAAADVPAIPSSDLTFEKTRAELAAACANKGVPSILGWELTQQRTSYALGFNRYRALIALHLFNCISPGAGPSFYGKGDRTVWLNPSGGVATLVALATLGGANTGLTPLSTFVGSTQSALFANNADEDFRNYIINIALSDAVGKICDARPNNITCTKVIRIKRRSTLPNF